MEATRLVQYSHTYTCLQFTHSSMILQTGYQFCYFFRFFLQKSFIYISISRFSSVISSSRFVVHRIGFGWCVCSMLHHRGTRKSQHSNRIFIVHFLHFIFFSLFSKVFNFLLFSGFSLCLSVCNEQTDDEWFVDNDDSDLEKFRKENRSKHIIFDATCMHLFNIQPSN